MLYGSLFVLSGAALLGTTYLLFRRATDRPVVVSTQSRTFGRPQVGRDERPLPGLGNLRRQAARDRRQRQETADRQRARESSQLLVQSGIALGIMALASIGLGWLMAGRVLRPLRTMTATTRRISEDTLDERLGLKGPSDELKDLGDTIDGLLARLEAAFEAHRGFVANASHELRTPLSMMRTSLDVATGKPGPVAPQLKALEGKLREGLDRADRLLEDFLILARAQHGALPEQTTVSFSATVCAAIEQRRAAISEKGLQLRHELHATQLTGSQTLLSHMIDNLIDNAIEHNEPSGWIGVQTQHDGRTARLIVDNGGPHLEESLVAQLTQPFRRLGAGRTGADHGLGLGLAIVAAIVAAHAGRLDLQARPHGGGMRVLVELPCSANGRPAQEPT